MPTRAPHPCAAPGCPALVTGPGRCPAHARPAPQDRPSAARRGYDRQWRTLRAQLAAEQPPACDVCGTTDRLELDHLTPLRAGGPNDPANLHWLCRRHHAQKTTRESGR